MELCVISKEKLKRLIENDIKYEPIDYKSYGIDLENAHEVMVEKILEQYCVPQTLSEIFCIKEVL